MRIGYRLFILRDAEINSHVVFVLVNTAIARASYFFTSVLVLFLILIILLRPLFLYPSLLFALPPPSAHSRLHSADGLSHNMKLYHTRTTFF
jgi:hypothetical protein